MSHPEKRWGGKLLEKMGSTNKIILKIQGVSFENKNFVKNTLLFAKSKYRPGRANVQLSLCDTV